MSTHRVDAFFTQDFALATVLATVGIPFSEPTRPYRLVYKLEDLRRHGKSVREMKAANIPGQVQWGFERTAELPAIEEDFARIFKAARPSPLEIGDITPRQAGAIISQALRNRKLLVNAWKDPEAPVYISVEVDGNTKYFTENTPKEVLAQMGVTVG